MPGPFPPPDGGAGIRLRPHHVFCLLGFQGYGYTPAFTANLAGVADRVLGAQAGEVTVTLAPGTDAVCRACPHRREDRCGRTPDSAGRVEEHDRRVLAALGLKAGARLDARALLKRAVERVDEAELARLCAGCPWWPLGLCAQGLRAAAGRGQPESGPAD